MLWYKVNLTPLKASKFFRRTIPEWKATTSGSSSLCLSQFVSVRLVRTSGLGQEVTASSLGTLFVRALSWVPDSISETGLLHDLS